MDDKCEEINYPTYYTNISKRFFPFASEIGNKIINWDAENNEENLNVQDYNEFELKSVEYYLDRDYSENVKKIFIPPVKRLHSSVIPHNLDPRKIRQCMRECLEELLLKINKYPAIGDSKESSDDDSQRLFKLQNPTPSITTIDSNTGRLCQISVETLKKINLNMPTAVTKLLSINEKQSGVGEKHCDEFNRRFSDAGKYKSFDSLDDKNNEESLKKYPELVADAVGSPINISIPLKKNLKLGYSFSRFTHSLTQHEKLSQVQCNVEKNDDYESLTAVITGSITETWPLKNIYSHKKYRKNKENNFFINNENVSDDLSEQLTEAEDSTDDIMTDRETRIGTVKCYRVSRVSNQEPEKNYRSSIEEKRDRVAGKLKKTELRQLNRQTDNTLVRNLKKQLSKDRINTTNIQENNVYDALSPKSPIKRRQHKKFETDIPKKRKIFRSSPKSSSDEMSPSEEYQKQEKNPHDIQKEEYNKSASSNSSKNKKYEKKPTYKSNKYERRKRYNRSHSSSPSPSSSFISSSEETSPKDKLNVTDKHKKNSDDTNSKQKIGYFFNEVTSNEKKDNDKHLSKRRKQEKVFNQRSSIDSGIGGATPSREVPEDSEKEELDPEYNNDNYKKISKNSDKYSKLSENSASSNVSIDKANLKQLEKKRQILKEQIKLINNNNENSNKNKLPSLPFISDASSDEDDNLTENVGSVRDQVHTSDEICENDTTAIIESESQKQRKLEIAKRSEEDAKRAIAGIVDYSSSEESVNSRMIPLRENISDILDTLSETNKINLGENNHLPKTKNHTTIANHQAKVNDHETGVNNHKFVDSSTDETLPSKSSHSFYPTESNMPSMTQSEMKVLSAKQLWIEDVKNHPTFLEKLADIVLTSNNNCHKEQNDFPNLEKFGDILFTTNNNSNNSNNNKEKNEFLNSTEFSQKIRVLNNEELGCKYTTPAPIHADFDKKKFDQISTTGSQIVEPINNTEVQEKEANYKKSQDQSCSSEVPMAPVDLSAEKKIMDKQNVNNNSCTPFIYNNINIINMTCSASTAIISSASTTATSSILTPTILNNSETKVILTQSLPTSIPLHTEVRVPETVSTLIAPKNTQISTLSGDNSQSQKLVTNGLNSQQISFPVTESNFRPNMPISIPTTQQETSTAPELPITSLVTQSTLRNVTGTISQSVSYAPMNVIQTQVSKSFTPSTSVAQPENLTNSITPLVAGQLPSNQIAVSTQTMKPPPLYSYPCPCEQCYQQNSSSNSRINPQMHEQYNVTQHQNSTTIENLYRNIVKYILFVRNMIIEFNKNRNIVNNITQRKQFDNDLFLIVMDITNIANRLKESLNLQHWNVFWQKVIAFSENLNDKRYIVNLEDIEKIVRAHQFYQMKQNLIPRQNLGRIKTPAQFNTTLQPSHTSSEIKLQGQYGCIPESSDVLRVPVPHSKINQNKQIYAQPTIAQSQQLNTSQIMMTQPPGINQNQQAYAQPTIAQSQQLNKAQMMMAQPPKINQSQQTYNQSINASPQQLNASQITMVQPPEVSQNQQAYAQFITFPQMTSTAIQQQQPKAVQRPIIQTPPTNIDGNQQFYVKPKKAILQQSNIVQITPIMSSEVKQNPSPYLAQMAAMPNKFFIPQGTSTVAPSQTNQHQKVYVQSRSSTQNVTIPEQSNNIPAVPSPNINLYQQASPQLRSSPQIAPPSQPPCNTVQATLESVPPPETIKYQENYEQPISLSQMLSTPQINTTQTILTTMLLANEIPNQQVHAQYKPSLEISSTSQQSKPVSAVLSYSEPSQLSYETGTIQSKPKKTRARKTIPTKKNRVPQVVEKTQNIVEEVHETMPESIRIELEKYQADFAEETRQKLNKQINLEHDSQIDQSPPIEFNMMQQINGKDTYNNHENMSQIKNKENANQSVNVIETEQLSTYPSNFHEKGSSDQIRLEDSSKTLSINKTSISNSTHVHQTENRTTSNIEVTNNGQNNKPNSCMISDAIEYLLVREENENSRKSKKSPAKKTEKTKNSSPQKPRKKLLLNACDNKSEDKVDPSEASKASKVQNDKNKENKSSDNSTCLKKNSETRAQTNIDSNNDAQDSTLIASCQRNEIDKNIRKENNEQNNFAESNFLEDIHRCLTPNINSSKSNEIITIDDEDEVVCSQAIIVKEEYIKHEIDFHDEIIDMSFLEDLKPSRDLKKSSDIKNINMNINKNLITHKMNLSAIGNNLPKNSVITLDDDDDEIDRVSKISSDRETVKMDLSEDDIIIEKEKIVSESYTYTNKCIDEEIECINLSRTVEKNSLTSSPESTDSGFPMNPVIAAVTNISSDTFDINIAAAEANRIDDDILDVTNVKIESEDEYFIT